MNEKNKIITLSSLHNTLTNIYNENSGYTESGFRLFLPTDTELELSNYQTTHEKCLTAKEINDKSTFFEPQNVINENELINENKLTYIERIPFNFLDIDINPYSSTIPAHKFYFTVDINDPEIKKFSEKIILDVYNVNKDNNEKEFVKSYNNTSPCYFPCVDIKRDDVTYDKTQTEIVFMTEYLGNIDSMEEWAVGFKCKYYKKDGEYYILKRISMGNNILWGDYYYQEDVTGNYIRIHENDLSFSVNEYDSLIIDISPDVILEHSDSENFDYIRGEINIENYVIANYPILYQQWPLTRIYIRVPKEMAATNLEGKNFNIIFNVVDVDEDGYTIDTGTFGNNAYMSFEIGPFTESDTNGKYFEVDIPRYTTPSTEDVGPDEIILENIPFDLILPLQRCITFNNIEGNSTNYDMSNTFVIEWSDEWHDGY